VTDPAAAGDADAHLALMLAVVGVGFVPVTIAAVGLAPQGTVRAWIFFAGLGITATVSIWAGVAGRRALAAGTSHTALTIGASIVGLVVGVTATLMALLSLVGSLL
jgi:hypothetical protein